MESQEAEVVQAMPSHGVTHQGKVRDHNEDAFLDLGEQGLWVVADGAGGHEKGEVASNLIVEELAKFTCQDELSANVNWLVERLRDVNQKLITMREDLAGGGLIGSTVAALLSHHGYVVCLWSGDSRVYLYRNGQLFLLTQDHNRWEEFLSAGFDENELKKYPMANQLIKAVGAGPVLGLDVQLYEMKPDDIYLLCSDGLSGELSEEEIISVLEADTDVREMADTLIAKTLNYQARDNITAITVGSKN
ncbi:MAG: PP2C family protein-serine/threonine phosphatase [Thiolinea sp.]